MVGGLGIGVISIISPLYISEVSIAKYRGRLVALYQLAVTIGFLGAYLVNYLLLDMAQSGTLLGIWWLDGIIATEVWRAMLGMAMWPAIAFLLYCFYTRKSPMAGFTWKRTTR